jgi:hypothetical protein
VRSPSFEKQFLVTADLGFSQDHTAICVLERTEATTGVERKEWVDEEDPWDSAYILEEEWKSAYELRWLERPPLKTSYPDICSRLQDMLFDPALRGNATLIVDATGVGRPVVQMMEEMGLSPVSVLVTGGSRESMDDEGMFHVPKKVIVTSLQMVFQERRIKVAEDLELVPVFLKELDNFKMKMNTQTGNTSYEAWRSSDHDDLVFAVGLGAWYGERQNEKQWRKKILNPQSPEALKLNVESRAHNVDRHATDSSLNSKGGKLLPFRPISRTAR